MSYSFTSDGISIVNEFMSCDEVNNLNNELDYLFLRKSNNGALGKIIVDKYTNYVMQPTLSVRSINLLELSLKVKKEFEKCSDNFSSYVNTGIEIIQEFNNPNHLPWHTDNRKSMVRAMVYIEGGQNKSGSFCYMKKTHIRDFFVEHHLSMQQIETYSPDIINCTEPPGTLILFDSFGFHGRGVCSNRRRVIMFEYQPPNSGFPKSAIPLSSRHLTEGVLKNLQVFLNDATQYNHGSDVYYRDPPKSNNVIKRIIRKFTNNY